MQRSGRKHRSSSFTKKKREALYMGNLDKKHIGTGILVLPKDLSDCCYSFKTRFFVLTKDALHWYKKTEDFGGDFDGESRGKISLVDIANIKVLDNDPADCCIPRNSTFTPSTIFELIGVDRDSRFFRAASEQSCQEWVNAIRAASMEALLNQDRPKEWMATIPPPRLQSTMWSDIEATDFKIRGKTYNDDKIKVSSEPSLFKLIAVDVFEVPEPTPNISGTGIVLAPYPRVAAQS